MCEGFSGFYCNNGKVYFIEPGYEGNISHSHIARRMLDKSIYSSDLVPFEFQKWTIESFRWDTNNVPTWASKKKCVEVFRKVKIIWLEYKKTCDPAKIDRYLRPLEE